MNIHISNSLLLLEQQIMESEEGFWVCKQCGHESDTDSSSLLDAVKTSVNELKLAAEKDVRQSNALRKISSYIDSHLSCYAGIGDEDPETYSFLVELQELASKNH